MTRKPGVIHRIASKTMDAGLKHADKVLKGEETLPEAVGAAVEGLFSSSKAKATTKVAKRVSPTDKASTKRKPTVKGGATRKRSKTGS